MGFFVLQLAIPPAQHIKPMPQTVTVHSPSTQCADYEEIQALFSARSARQYAAETRRLRNEAQSDRPSVVRFNRALDALNWQSRRAVLAQA